MTADYSFNQRIQGAFTGLGFPYEQIEVRSKTLISGELFYVEAILMSRQGYRLRILVVDTGHEAILFMEPQTAHNLLTLPALESYTVDHPWIVGV